MLISNIKRGRNLELIMWSILLIQIVGLISSYLQYDLILMAQEGLLLSQEAADSNDIRELIISRVYSCAYIAAVVLFIFWFRRAYNNLNRIGIDTDYPEGWAAGSWFVPFLNLYRPYQIMKELYVKTYRQFKGKHDQFEGLKDLNLVTVWWTLWIVLNVLGQISSKVSVNAETIDQLINATIVHMIFYVIGMITLWFAIKVIKNYTAIEPLLEEMSIENSEEEESIASIATIG